MANANRCYVLFKKDVDNAVLLSVFTTLLLIHIWFLLSLMFAARPIISLTSYFTLSLPACCKRIATLFNNAIFHCNLQTSIQYHSNGRQVKRICKPYKIKPNLQIMDRRELVKKNVKNSCFKCMKDFEWTTRGSKY